MAWAAGKCQGSRVQKPGHLSNMRVPASAYDLPWLLRALHHQLPSAPTKFTFLLSHANRLAFTLPNQVPTHLEILSMPPITHCPLPSSHADHLLVILRDSVQSSFLPGNQCPFPTTSHTHTHTQSHICAPTDTFRGNHTQTHSCTLTHSHTSHMSCTLTHITHSYSHEFCECRCPGPLGPIREAAEAASSGEKLNLEAHFLLKADPPPASIFTDLIMGSSPR